MGIINNRLSMSAVTDDLNAKEIAIVNPSDDPTTDLYPGYVMGAQAIFGTVYWILSWFIYIKKNAIFNLKVNDINTITLSWMFENLMSTQYGWVSGSLFITFWVHMFTSLIETIAWVLWYFDDGELLAWWASTVGWWGSVVVMPLPTLFGLFQILFVTKKGGFNGNLD